MDKRYQVFISSTYLDLQDERQAVLKAILEINHMPAGMELFPATDDSAWQLIRDVIDSSDYYVLIIGGRYGSRDEAGLSYTEKEYDYAVEAGTPVIPLLHEHPGSLRRDRTDEGEAWESLLKFRSKVEKKHTCVYWQNADDLKAKVIVGLTTATKRHPAVGWVRADGATSQTTLLELLALRDRVAELEAEVVDARDKPPPGTESLAQGEDTFDFKVRFAVVEQTTTYPFQENTPHVTSIQLTWNAIFAAVAPSMINEAPESTLRRAFHDFLEGACLRQLGRRKELVGREVCNFEFNKGEIETCIVQMRALGLIRESNKKRSVKDMGTYWTLTPYGNTLMVKLRAIRRQPLEKSEADDGASPQE